MNYPHVNPPQYSHQPDFRDQYARHQAQNRRHRWWHTLDICLAAALWLLPLAFIVLTLIFPGTWIIVASSQDCVKYPTTCMDPYDIPKDLILGTGLALVIGLAGTALSTTRRWPHLPAAIIGAVILMWTWVAAFGTAFA